MLSEKYAGLTPYQFGANNPVLLNDPMGDKYQRQVEQNEEPRVFGDWSAIFGGSGGGGAVAFMGGGGSDNSSRNNNDFSEFWKNFENTIFQNAPNGTTHVQIFQVNDKDGNQIGTVFAITAPLNSSDDNQKIGMKIFTGLYLLKIY